MRPGVCVGGICIALPFASNNSLANDSAARPGDQHGLGQLCSCPTRKTRGPTLQTTYANVGSGCQFLVRLNARRSPELASVYPGFQFPQAERQILSEPDSVDLVFGTFLGPPIPSALLQFAPRVVFDCFSGQLSRFNSGTNCHCRPCSRRLALWWTSQSVRSGWTGGSAAIRHPCSTWLLLNSDFPTVFLIREY
jgi:hypothetical protein